jgi:hypothetical protein
MQKISKELLESIEQTKNFVDSVARVYANFYLENPNINTDSQKNKDFRAIINCCTDQIDNLVEIRAAGFKGSVNWWKAVFKTLDTNPPEELKQYLSWGDWD